MPGLMRPHLAEHNEVLPTPLQAKKCRGVKLDKLRSFVNPYQGLVLCLYHHTYIGWYGSCILLQ